MIYSLSEKIVEQGNQSFIRIPFNLWEECGQKGLIPIKACIQDIDFECRLVSKGEGVYRPSTPDSVAEMIDFTSLLALLGKANSILLEEKEHGGGVRGGKIWRYCANCIPHLHLPSKRLL